jgi:hypothetical protein
LLYLAAAQVRMAGGMLVATLVYSLIIAADVQPWRAAGMESKDCFLRRRVNDYSALAFVQTSLARQARVLMLWDAQGYYCDERCIPDAEHSRWTRLVEEASPEVESVAARLKAMGVTHLFTVSDADFILQHDLTGQHRRAADFFLREFRPACAQEVYRDRWATLYQLTCSWEGIQAQKAVAWKR